MECLLVAQLPLCVGPVVLWCRFEHTGASLNRFKHYQMARDKPTIVTQQQVKNAKNANLPSPRA